MVNCSECKETEQIETELNVDELTEEEYKAMCQVAYIEDFEEEKSKMDNL